LVFGLALLAPEIDLALHRKDEIGFRAGALEANLFTLFVTNPAKECSRVSSVFALFLDWRWKVGFIIN
jgi:hypothetical protein